MSAPVQIVVAAFKDEKAAEKALEDLKKAQSEGLIKIEEAAVLDKTADGALRIKETADMGGGKGAAIGGLLGAAIGVIAGPVGWMALGGAAIGSLAAKLKDGGFQDARLRQLGESLTPGSSALVAVVEHTWVTEVERMMAEDAVTVATESIAQDISDQLRSGNDVVYTAIQTDSGGMAARITAAAPGATTGSTAGQIEDKGPETKNP